MRHTEVPGPTNSSRQELQQQEHLSRPLRHTGLLCRAIRIVLAAGALVSCVFSPTGANAALIPNSTGATVYDSVNNINWLADANLAASNRFGLPVCASSGSQQSCVNASGSMHYDVAVAWVAAMNAANYLGHKNWQLPTTPLIDKTCPKVGPNGGSFGFGCTLGALDSMYNALGLKPPNTAVSIPSNTVGPFSNIQPYLYWSQSSTAVATQGNATFSFATGWQGANTLPNFLYVLPMLPGKIPGSPSATGTGLQVSADKQTVYDPITNITWLANANLAATNDFGLPRCTDPTTPALCVAQDGAMTFDSATQFIANMNNAAYLGQKNWQMPTIDAANCPGYNCSGNANPMGNLFYVQLGFSQGASAVVVPDITVGPFHNIQPYLYWTCGGDTIQSPCQAAGPAPNFEWSYSFGSGFQGTDLLANDLYVTAYYVGPPSTANPPAVPANSVVNNASFASGANPLAPGTIAAVFGTNLDDGSSNAFSSFGSKGELLTTLGGASVSFNGIAAPLFSAFPGQLNVEIPQELAGQTSATVLVTTGGLISAPQTVPIGGFSPGIFTIPSGGTGQGAIQISNTATFAAPQGSIPGASANPVSPGQSITIFCTGLGAVTNPPATGAPASSGPLSTTLTTPLVSIDGIPANVSFSGLAPGFVGLYQVNAQIPAGVPSGNAIPLVLSIGGVRSNTVTVAIASGGGAGQPYSITSISVCSASGASGAGSCPAGSFDTHQIVLGPNGSSVNSSGLGVGPVPDEHSSVFAPGTLGTNQDYLFFLASPEGGHGEIGVAVLSGGSGPDKNGQWTLDFPRADGYGSYASGFGQVFNPSSRGDVCPIVADGNPAHQDQTFDMHYAAPGSVVKDPSAGPGALLMVYEGTNACIGNAGGPVLSNTDDYISLAIATSLDYGKSWPTYRGTPTFNFVPLPGVNQTQGPNAPMGALGKNVCMGNDCTATPPASYGRYPIVTPPTSLASLMAAGKPLTAKFGEQEISGFVDDVAGNAAPYLYANSGDVRVARAQLNGGSAPLTFQKWNGQAFTSPGLGGVETSVLPAGAFANCEAPAQLQYGSSISYVEDTQQYLLTFLCDSPADPAQGPGSGHPGAAWFYSTNSGLSDQTQWAPPREIAGSWSEFDQSGGCPDYKGYYPTFMSLSKGVGHLSLTGYVFYLWGCQGGSASAPARQFASRSFTIATN